MACMAYHSANSTYQEASEMCLPVAALLPIAIGAGSGLLSGSSSNASASSQASALTRNAGYLDRAAADTRIRGAYDADWQRVQTQGLIGAQRVAQAANGGRVDQDTNATITQDTAQLGELDALTIMNNAARQAYGYEVEAEDNRRTARNLRQQGRSGLITSLLGGAVTGGLSAFAGGLFGGGGAAAGTTQALKGSTSRLNFNQALA